MFFILYHEAKMLACKGIFAKPSIPQVRIAHGGAAAKTYAVRLSEDIISYMIKMSIYFSKTTNNLATKIPYNQNRN